ncbi:MAG: DNA polymerase [Clostridiales bacterium]
MRTLQIDIETYSGIDLLKAGVYKYVDSPHFEILLFGYAFDDDPITVIDLTDFEELPEDVIAALADPAITKTAFNANFERTCIAKHFGIVCDPTQWQCTAVWARALGLPGNLEKAAEALGLETQKDARGKNLIKYFSYPCKPTKANGGRTRNYPYHDPEKWQQYINYNRQDVVVEREIRRALAKYPLPDSEWLLWALDQTINDTGVLMDAVIAKNAIECNEIFISNAIANAKSLTGLDNPNSLTQLKNWLADQGVETPDGIRKENITDLIETAPTAEVKKVLELRRDTGKTSVGKYEAMERSVCSDDRIRGVFKFYGAGTGRWSGQIFQPQNLPQNKIPDLADARSVLRSGDFEMLEMLYGAPPFVLSQLIRTALTPKPGCRFIVADFSAIEARVIAWLADENWALEVFRTTGKIYEAAAAQMFKVPVETIVKGHVNYDLRARGKVATLGLGYAMGATKFKDTAEKSYHIDFTEGEAKDIVAKWRSANKNIVKPWYAVEKAAQRATQDKVTVDVAHGVRFRYAPGILFAELPGGRSLAYQKPRLEIQEKFQKNGLVFNTPKKGTMLKESTYGGKLVENLVQAIARDCLAVSMMKLTEEGYNIVMHVHDEVIIEAPEGTGSVENVTAIMGQPIPWAPRLPLKAAGYECDFYMKD